MPVFKGINSTSPIYNGNAKIVKIFKGLDLVYQSSLPTSDLFITSLCKVTDGTTPTVVDEYTMVSSTTTAVEGTQYYRYSGDKFSPVSISTGVAVGDDVATRNDSYDTDTGNIMIDLLAYKSSITQIPEKFIINNTAKYNGSYYDIGKITAKMDLSKIGTSLTKEVYLSNKHSLVDNVLTSTAEVQAFLNLEKLTIASNNIGFKFGPEGTYTTLPGANNGGVILTFKGSDITKISRTCLPYHSSQGGYRYALSVKQIIFDTTNLKYIGPMGLVYGNTVSNLPIPEVVIPDTVAFLALLSETMSGTSGISTNATTLLPNTISNTSELVYKTTTPNAQGKYWALIQGDTPTIDSNSIGIDYRAKVAQTNVVIPETVKHISGFRLYDDTSTSTYANKNLYYNCNVEKAETYVDVNTYGPLSTIDVENIIFGANVTIIPKNMFYRPSSIGPNLYFNQPDGVNVNIEKGCFNYKSATSKNIYTENTSVRNYDWSTNENITPTFYHLDGTAW